MATPYWQVRLEEVPSTQDLAVASLERLPVVVTAAAQAEGRGRSGAQWVNAPRALAVSMAFHRQSDDSRPLSLMAGVAAHRILDPVGLKWPNDLEMGDSKVGGILVEQSGGVAVVGLGVNLWWPHPPDGIGALFGDDPGPDRFAELGSLWAGEIIDLIGREGWPHDEYVAACTTLGRRITWEPDGSGTAVAVADSGALLVDDGTGRAEIHSGAVRHVRS